MAVNITAKTRCTNKNLMTGATPPGGGSPTDMVSASLQVIADTANPDMSGSVSLTYPLVGDTVQIGLYYDMTLIDGVAPTAAKKSTP